MMYIFINYTTIRLFSQQFNCKHLEFYTIFYKIILFIEQFKDAFKEALNAGEPVVLDCHIDLDDKVWPMVNPGGSIEDAFDKADLEAQAR